ncbi:MAG: hypothetical protein RL254_1017 [Planctomycetota bacterium]|jgi:hypothetical protein
MAWTLIASAVEGTDSAPATTASINTSGAKLLVVTVGGYAPSGPFTLSDNKSNTWTGITSQTLGDNYQRIYYCINPTVGSGHTFTLSATGGIYGGPCVQAWGCDGDVAYGGESGSTADATTIQPGSVTPSQNGSLIFTGMVMGNGGSTIVLPSINSGFTLSPSYKVRTGGWYGLFSAYLVETTAAAVNPTWTFTMEYGTPRLTSTIAWFTETNTYSVDQSSFRFGVDE